MPCNGKTDMTKQNVNNMTIHPSYIRILLDVRQFAKGG